MATIFDNFSNERSAFINPGDFTQKIPDFPEVCMTTFSEKIINKFVEDHQSKVITHIYSANGVIPIYEIKYADTTIGLFLSRVGAPACVAGLEEVIAMGAEKIVHFGCCGVLNQSVVENKIIIPSSAVRDEGTSYHYIPKSEEISADIFAITLTKQSLEKLKIPYVVGKVWTTDAIYRETSKLIEERKKQGCLGVEMECSASLAVARFRNVPMIQFLYGADSLDSDIWEPRDLTDYGIALTDKYMTIALECAAALQTHTFSTEPVDARTLNT